MTGTIPKGEIMAQALNATADRAILLATLRRTRTGLTAITVATRDLERLEQMIEDIDDTLFALEEPNP